jgi:hypothetical protein
LDVAIAFANHQRWKMGGTSKLPISPLEGLLQNWVDVIPCF